MPNDKSRNAKWHCKAQKKVVRRPHPSFAACVNIKAYYFSISVSNRTRNFLIYTCGRTAATAKPNPRVTPPRYRAGKKRVRRSHSRLSCYKRSRHPPVSGFFSSLSFSFLAWFQSRPSHFFFSFSLFPCRCS